MRALTRQDEESKMVRNVFGSLIALIGATAVVWSPFRAWYDGRHGRDVRIDDLFTGWDGGPGTDVALLRSLLLPMLCAALLALLGLALRVRPLVALAGLVALGFTVLWMVRQGQATGHLVLDGEGNGLGVGVAGALGGSILLLIAAALMTKRPTRRVDGAPRAVPRDDVRTRGARGARAAFDGRYDGTPGPTPPYGTPGAYGTAGTYGTGQGTYGAAQGRGAAQGYGTYGGGTGRRGPMAYGGTAPGGAAPYGGATTGENAYRGVTTDDGTGDRTVAGGRTAAGGGAYGGAAAGGRTAAGSGSAAAGGGQSGPSPAFPGVGARPGTRPPPPGTWPA
ncbi:hypothetical protein AAHZ94_16150, partial [Streptomyces sp. HSW2009]|uniref:hypothetical protein n=1 Tax=Streptomyces sp. HSW2009 TaxID=3142890 RepID=UPI0032EB8770